VIDPLQQLADRHIILASAEIEAELRSGNGSGPTLAIWRMLRARAAQSLAQLVNLNVHVPADRILLVTHQNEVKRYIEFAQAMVQIFHNGVALEKELSAQERRDLIDLIKGMPEEERALIDTGPRDDEGEPTDD
jgi:hypothetical protein